ncbi:hypothetical protein [uncultured Jannaschia sp.]|uniref:hypothetical protein n=1 Tax=uncultured Jannaschia sp. TaxID=293347 RepID=UPI00261FDEFC|nr:hypothetical protein [uncultured Jannaschia sp.]
MPKWLPILSEDAMLTRNDLIREYRNRAGSLPALVLVYALIVGTMALTAMTIV